VINPSTLLKSLVILAKLLFCFHSVYNENKYLKSRKVHMCGRYTLTVTSEQLIARYDVEEWNHPYTPRYNIAPGQFITAVIYDGEKNRLGELKWGLVPNWARDASIGYKMINARSETLLEKPAFRNLVNRKRCLIPADGFYEWKRAGDKKQPMRIMMKNQEIFSFAGLYDTWVSPAGEKISTCTIITTTPNRLMADIHNRMPVILRRENEAMWLDRSNQNTVELLSLLQSYSSEEMTAYPVPAIVGNVKNDSPECIKSLVE
jgi:putative SOS response-associated peptidase YedK